MTAEETAPPGPLETYWQRAAHGEFVLPTCGQCGYRFLPPQRGCPRCAGEDIDWTETEGAGTLYSFSEVPGKDDHAPAVIAVAELEDLSEGSRLYSRLVEHVGTRIRIGSRVRVECRDLGSGNRVPVLVAMEDQP